MSRQGIDPFRGSLLHAAVVAVGRLPCLDQVRRSHRETVIPPHPAHHHAAFDVDSAAPDVRPDFAAPPEAAALNPVARKAYDWYLNSP